MCDADKCANIVDARRRGRTRDGRQVTLSLCVRHRQDFDSGDGVETATMGRVSP
jgi:hypothetical protein